MNGCSALGGAAVYSDPEPKNSKNDIENKNVGACIIRREQDVAIGTSLAQDRLPMQPSRRALLTIAVRYRRLRLFRVKCT